MSDREKVRFLLECLQKGDGIDAVENQLLSLLGDGEPVGHAERGPFNTFEHREDDLEIVADIVLTKDGGIEVREPAPSEAEKKGVLKVIDEYARQTGDLLDDQVILEALHAAGYFHPPVESQEVVDVWEIQRLDGVRWVPLMTLHHKGSAEDRITRMHQEDYAHVLRLVYATLTYSQPEG